MQFAVGGVGVAVAAPCQKAVLCVIRAAIAVAVGLIAVVANRCAVLRNGFQTSGSVVGVALSVVCAVDAFGFGSDAPQFVASVAPLRKGGIPSVGGIAVGFTKAVVGLAGGEAAQGCAVQQPTLLGFVAEGEAACLGE